MTHPSAQDVVNLMEQAGADVDRESYIQFAWSGIDVSNWDAEYEDMLPEELQDWSLFKYDDTEGLKYIGPKIDTGAPEQETEEDYEFEPSAEGDEDTEEPVEDHLPFGDLNPYHVAHGEKGGQFATGPGQGLAAQRAQGLKRKTGGDKWNRETAERLEAEYQKAKPAIERSLKGLVEASAAVPRTWEQLSKEQQEQAWQSYRTKQGAIHARQKASSEDIERWTTSAWKGFTSEQKFYYVEGVDKFAPVIEEPDKYVPMGQEGSGSTPLRNYRRTQTVADHLFTRRAVELFNKAKLPGTPADIRRVDNDLWEQGWVDGGSTSPQGLLIQLAMHEELGSRWRPPWNWGKEEEGQAFNIRGLKDYARTSYPEIGGYDGIKAMMRAKWETTQYLLDRGDVDNVEVYRAINIDGIEDAVIDKTQTVETVPEGVYAAQRLPDWNLQRNGAQSTSTNSSIPNGWDGDKDRVVIRVKAPRTAVLSIPAMGKNEFLESEVVLTGTAWDAWDAWLSRAPYVSAVPFRESKMTDHTQDAKPDHQPNTLASKTIDLGLADAANPGRKHWLHPSVANSKGKGKPRSDGSHPIDPSGASPPNEEN